MLVRHALRPARLPRAPRAARSVATSHEAAMPLDGTQRLGKVKRWRFEPRQMHLARSSAAEAHALAAGVAPSVEKDHETLRDLLDRPRLHTPQDTAGLPTGLFEVEALREPHAFMTLAEKTLVRAQLLVHRIARAGAPDAPRAELARVVPNLDRLSDLLCGVIDMAELLRHAHPEPAWAEASNAAYEYLCNFMNILNTHTGLYDSLRRAMGDAAIWAHLPEEAQAVATIFLRDFEKSGIHLPPQERERFVALSDEILVLGRAFLQDISARTSDQVTDFPLDLLRTMDAGLVKSLRAQTGFSRRSNTLPVVPGSWELHCITKFAPDERARRLAYLITYTGRHGPVDVLERLLRARHELAVLTGKRSFAEMTLVDKMAGTPSNVSDFLHITAEAQRPRAQAMIEALRALKTPPDAPVYAWDREYLSDAYVQTYHPPDLQPLAPYLSLGSVFTGLSRLFYLLYGIHFRAAPVRPGEVWSPDVLKLEVVDETEGGVIGTIYCDLYARAGKPPSAAHYTVRCSRRIDGDDVENDVRFGDAPDLPRDVDLSNLLDVQGVASPGRPGRFQLPVVVLMTEFQWPSRAQGGVSLLRWQEVETLFHEMGHALHCTSPARSPSHDRTHRVPQRVRHTLRDRLRRAAVDPHGALPREPRGGAAHRPPPPHRRSAPVRPARRTPPHAARARRTRHPAPDRPRAARPAVPRGARRRPRIQLHRRAAARPGEHGPLPARRGRHVAGAVRTPVRLRRDILQLPVRPRDRRARLAPGVCARAALARRRRDVQKGGAAARRREEPLDDARHRPARRPDRIGRRPRHADHRPLGVGPHRRRARPIASCRVAPPAPDHVNSAVPAAGLVSRAPIAPPAATMIIVVRRHAALTPSTT